MGEKKTGRNRKNWKKQEEMVRNKKKKWEETGNAGRVGGKWK